MPPYMIYLCIVYIIKKDMASVSYISFCGIIYEYIYNRRDGVKKG